MDIKEAPERPLYKDDIVVHAPNKHLDLRPSKLQAK